MPDNSDVYTQKFEAELDVNINQYDAKIKKATEANNKFAESLERANKAGGVGRSGFSDVSPYSKRLYEAKRELSAMNKAGFYRPEAIKQQQKEVDQLFSKEQKFLKETARVERRENQQTIKEKKQKQQELHNEKKRQERDVEREASAWQKWSRMVLRQDNDESRKNRQEEKRHQQEQKKQQQEQIRNMNVIARITNRAMYSVGLGRFAPLVTTAAQTGGGFLNQSLGALAGSRMGVPLLGMLGGGVAAIGGIIHAARNASSAIMKQTPGWAEQVANTQYRMPETALELTREGRGLTLGKNVLWESIKDVLSERWESTINTLRTKTYPLGPGGVLISKGIGYLHGIGGDQAEKQEELYQSERNLNIRLSTRENRLRALGRVFGGAESMLQAAPEDEMSKMGIYATAGQAYQSTHNVQLQEQLIDAMRRLVGVLEGDKGNAVLQSALKDVFGWRGK